MTKNTAPMVIIGVLFFIFGFVTWLNGSLIPYLKILCELSDFEALFVTFAFYIAYTLMALPSSFILDRVGFKNGMSIGLLTMSFGAILFIPSAYSSSFVMFLVALFTLATGLTLLQSASNPYIVYLGDIKSAARRISIMGIINKLAGVVAPIVFSILVFSETKVDAGDLVFPYTLMAIILLALVALVRFLPDIAQEIKPSEDLQKSIFSFAKVVLGSIALFFYVGIEVIAGDTIGLYAQSLGVANPTILTSYTMFFMVVGYSLGVLFIPRFISTQKALALSAISGLVFIALIVSLPEDISILSLPAPIFFIALLGLSNALVWPSIWPLALEGIGAYSTKATALLIMAIAGGALLPLLFGKISQYFSMQDAYSIGFVCYIFILLYATKWHKKMSWYDRV